MKKLKILIVLILTISQISVSYSQVKKCNDMLSDGDSVFSKKLYKQAIKYYLAAKSCNQLLGNEADKRILKVFDEIDNLKIRAENAEKDAVRKQKELEKEKNKALTAQTQAEEAGNKLTQETEFRKRETARADSSRAELNVFEQAKNKLPGNEQQKIDQEINNLRQNQSTVKLSENQSYGNSLENAPKTDSVQQGRNSIIENKTITFSENQFNHNPLENTPRTVVNNNVENKAYPLNQKLYSEVKKALDSLISARKPAINNDLPENKPEEIVFFIEAKLNNSINGEQLAKHLYDSSKSAISKLIDNSQKISEDLLYTYQRSVLYHSWDLMDRKKPDSAGLILQQAFSIISKNKLASAKIYYGLSGIENALSRYLQMTGNDPDSYSHAVTAVENVKNAVLLKTDNYLYQKCLSTYLRNLYYVSNSLLSKNEKYWYKKLGCEVADYLETSFPTKGFGIGTVIDCATEEAESLVTAKEYQKALNILNGANEKINVYIKEKPLEKANYLLKALIFSKMASIANYNLKNIEYQENYTKKSLENWLKVIQGGITGQTNLRQLQNVFDKIVENCSSIPVLAEQKSMYGKIITVTESLPNKDIMLPQIAYIYLTTNLSLGELYNKQKTKSDSLKALSCFTKSIEIFEKAKVIENYTGYSEDYAKFCKPYSERIKIFISQNNYELAKKDYETMMKVFDPFYKKYRFDFYFNQHLISALKLYGEYLFQKEKFKEAIPVLELSSVEGTKQSTDYLINIYENRKSGFADTTQLRITKKRGGYQKDGMKKFTIPTLFGDTKYPFDVYVLDRDPDYPYRGIEDQVEWIKIARGGIIPEEVRNSFKKLQDLAWKNNVSFQELCVYALDAANENTVIEKYKPYKKEIESENNISRKGDLYDKLFNLYEQDIEKDSANRKVIEKDAVKLYNQYAGFLASKASEVFKRTLKLDNSNKEANDGLLKIEYYNNKANIELLTKSRSTEELMIILGLYLEEEDKKNGAIIVQKILSLKDDAKTRDEISSIYLTKTMDTNFEKLFLSNKEKLKEYRDYFINKGISKIPTNAYKRVHYYNLVELDKAYLEINASDSVKKSIAQHYNSLGWYCLLSKRFNNVLSYFNKSLQYDSTYLYPLGNLPHAYLFNNEFEKAKSLYLKYKDLPFDKEGGYPTFKDAFLSDFKDFEKEGITNDYIKEITRLLTE